MVYLSKNKYAIREVFSETTPFRSIYIVEEKAKLIELYKRVKNFPWLYENEVVRLDSLEKSDLPCNKTNIATLSVITYSDFVIGQMLTLMYGEMFLHASEEERDLLRIGAGIMKTRKELNYVQDILEHEFMPNALAISVMIKDINNNFLITRRNNSVAISPCLYSTSVTAAVTLKDLEPNRTVQNCVIREVKAELGIDVTFEQIKIVEVVAGELKQQPVVLCNVELDTDLYGIVMSIMQTKGFTKENDFLKIFDISRINECIDVCSMTEAGKYHLQTLCGRDDENN